MTRRSHLACALEQNSDFHRVLAAIVRKEAPFERALTRGLHTTRAWSGKIESTPRQGGFSEGKQMLKDGVLLFVRFKWVANMSWLLEL